jgi:hypothetical protein
MMQGDPRVDDLMRPVNVAIRRHVKDAAAVTDIYNRAYEALMISMDVKDAEISSLLAVIDKAVDCYFNDKGDIIKIKDAMYALRGKVEPK